MTLELDLLPADVKIGEGDLEFGRTDILLEAAQFEADLRSFVPDDESAEKTVVEIPARTAKETLAYLIAAFRLNLAPLPRQISTPRKTDLVSARGEIVLATSGSGGAVKYPEFALESLLANARLIRDNLGIDARDHVALLQPLDHSFGLVGQLFTALVAGAKIIDARVPFLDEQLTRLRDVTVLASVSYTLRRIFLESPKFPHLRLVGSAGGPFPGALRDSLRASHPEVELANQYGTTEAGPRLTSSSSKNPAFERGSVGVPLPGIELKLGDGGEVLFRSPTAMLGYLGDERLTEQTRVGDFLRTGDVGRIEEGQLFVDGRKDDVVKVRGVKVSLAEIARVAEELTSGGAFAFATNDENGEASITLVVEHRLTRQHLRPHLPLDRLPSDIHVVSSLPRLASGKLDRAKIRRLFEAK